MIVDQQTIKDVLDKYADNQINLASDAARDKLAEEICYEIRKKYLEKWRQSYAHTI